VVTSRDALQLHLLQRHRHVRPALRFRSTENVLRELERYRNRFISFAMTILPPITGAPSSCCRDAGAEDRSQGLELPGAGGGGPPGGVAGFNAALRAKIAYVGFESINPAT